MEKLDQKAYKSSIAHVRSRIRCLQSRKGDLLRQLTEVKTSLGVCHAELAFLSNGRSSVSALPSEVLGMILESARDLPLKQCWRSPRSEVIFSHVTRRWRRVALSIPSLWTDVLASPKRALEELVAYLERSRASPLCIRWDICPSSSNQRTDPDDLLDILSAHASRWRRLVIDAPDMHATPVAVQLPDLDTPLLEHLSISNVITYCTSHPIIFTGGAPLLSFLRLDGFLAQSLPRPLPVPHSRLTTLHLDDAWYEDDPMSYHEFSEFIAAAATTLVNLSIQGPVVELDPAIWPPALIEMPALQSIRMACDAATGHILAVGISAPVLRSFHMKGISDGMALDETGDFEEDAWNFMTEQRNFPALDSITFMDCSLSSWTFQRLTKAYHTVSHLSLIYLQPDVLECFLDSLVLETLWPNLCSVSLHHGEESPLKGSWITSFVDARIRAGRPINYIELDEPDLSKLMGIKNLPQNVNLQLANPYTWPEDLGYRDEDDDFMVLFD